MQERKFSYYTPSDSRPIVHRGDEISRLQVPEDATWASLSVNYKFANARTGRIGIYKLDDELRPKIKELLARHGLSANFSFYSGPYKKGEVNINFVVQMQPATHTKDDLSNLLLLAKDAALTEQAGQLVEGLVNDKLEHQNGQPGIWAWEKKHRGGAAELPQGRG